MSRRPVLSLYQYIIVFFSLVKTPNIYNIYWSVHDLYLRPFALFRFYILVHIQSLFIFFRFSLFPCTNARKVDDCFHCIGPRGEFGAARPPETLVPPPPTTNCPGNPKWRSSPNASPAVYIYKYKRNSRVPGITGPSICANRFAKGRTYIQTDYMYTPWMQSYGNRKSK